MSTATYRVRILPESHHLEVKLTLTGLTEGPLRLQLPTWVPGAYGFMKYGRDFYDLEARANCQPLPLTREGWQGFRVDRVSGDVELSWRAYTHDPAWGELVGIVDHEHAVLIGPRYLKVLDHTGPVRARYELPEGWNLHHPDGAKALEPHSFEYPSFEVLYDTPVVAGRFDLITRECAGTPFHFLFLDRALGFSAETDRFLSEVMAVAEACRALFGSFPFAHYTFVFTFNPDAGWGLEHLTSTMIALGDEALIDGDERKRGVRVSAHELFHAWNVCRLKPAPFMRPDFTHGSFTEGLWVAEGFTRYYEFLLLVRAGVLTVEEFFSNVVNYYRQLVSQPGYARTSVRDSSITTFLNHNRYPGSINNTIDYYDHGMLVAFDLDAHLRTLPKPSSLDTEFRAFYEAYVGQGDGYTHEELVRFFGARTDGTEALLRREVEKAGTLSVVETLQRLGFEVGCASPKRAGLVLKKGAGPVIDNVVEGTPAWQSGLAPGDELLKVNGYAYTLKALRWAIAHEQELSLEVKRGHRIFPLTLAPAPKEELSTLTWRGDATQLERLRAWFGQPALTFAAGQTVSLASFENFHGLQTVL